MYQEHMPRYGIRHISREIELLKIHQSNPRKKDPVDKKSWAIYWYQSEELTCHDEYICQTPRTFGERYKEHLKEPSPIFAHSNISGHNTNPDNFTI